MRQAKQATQYGVRSLALVVAAISLFLMSSLSAQNIAIAHCQGSCPSYGSSLVGSRANVVVHNLYAAGLNGDSGKADWVAYRVTKEAVGVASLLPRFWQADDLVKLSGIEELAEAEAIGFSLAEISGNSSPYGGFNEPPSLGEERARLAPMTSFANTPYWQELNNLSNMVPMPNALRRGAWLQLEQRLNRMVSDDAFGVITGPLYLINQPLNLSGSQAALNPSAYFKVVVDGSGFAAFVFPGDIAQTERFCDFQAELSSIEQMSNLDLFPKGDPKPSARMLRTLGCSGN